jgi:hypothetical protein
VIILLVVVAKQDVSVASLPNTDCNILQRLFFEVEITQVIFDCYVLTK